MRGRLKKFLILRVERNVIGRNGASLDELEALYRSRFDVFARVAASVTGDSERARDAVQEAFATARARDAQFTHSVLFVSELPQYAGAHRRRGGE